MLSNIILRSTAAFGGAPFRLNKCTALGSAGAGAAGGAAVGGVPSHDRVVHYFLVFLEIIIPIRLIK